MTRLLKFAYASTYDAPLGKALPHELVEADRFRAEFDTLPAPPPGDGEWNENRRRLRALAATQDPRGFLRWDVLVRTMVVSPQQLYVVREFSALLPAWRQWRSVVEDAPIGHPWPFPLFPRTSANTIHQAYHLHRFERSTGLRLEEMEQVVEVGGGYGGLCRLIHRRGFRGRYNIIDLPEFSALQRYFLGASGIRVTHNEAATRGLRTLLVANWSLSEMSLADRQTALDACPDLSAALIAYQNTFHGMDNLAFFREWSKGTGLLVEDSPIKHLPGNRYLFAHE